MQHRNVTNCEQLLDGNPRLIQSQIIDYRIFLRQDKKLTPSTTHTILAALRKFYDMNDIEPK